MELHFVNGDIAEECEKYILRDIFFLSDFVLMTVKYTVICFIET